MTETRTEECRKICGWCGINLGTIIAEVPVTQTSNSQEMVSHGICEICSDDLIAKSQEEFAVIKSA